MIRPLYGANSLNIIIPEGIRDDGKLTGHTHLFIRPSRQIDVKRCN